MNISKIAQTVQNLGMIIILIGLLLKLSYVQQSLYVYGFGVLLLFAIRIYNLISGGSEKHRHNFIFITSAVLLALSFYAMLENHTWWVIPIAGAAIIEFYMSFRIKNRVK